MIAPKVPPAASESTMVIGRRLPEDREALEAMYAEVFGRDALAESRERWQWQYELNPHCPPEGPDIWVAKEGGEILGQYATMNVRLKIKDRILQGSWGMDVMVNPHLQKKGVGTQLFNYWDQHIEAPLGLGLSVSSYALFKKLQWHDVGPVPCFTKPLDVRALLRRRFGVLPAVIIAPLVKAGLWIRYPERKPSPEDYIQIRRLEEPFGKAFDKLWHKASRGYDFVVERESRYLEWKFHRIPYVSYEIYQALRGGELAGYVVLRQAVKNGVRLGLVVDLFAHPEDSAACDALIDWASKWGKDHRVARLQTFTFHRQWSERLRRKGYIRIKSPMQFCLHIHSDHVGGSFFQDTSRWHVTFGDSDMDRTE